MTTAARTTAVQYLYDFATLDRVPEGPTSAQVAARRLLSGPTLATGKSSTVGAVLTGSSIILTLGTQARGSGAKPHTHPNEQFNYVLEGTMVNDIEGELVFARPGTLLHTPTSAVHTGLACPDEDLLFLAIKDTRHGIVGPPVDGKYTGPNYLPGFGERAGEPMKTTAQMIAEAGRDPVGEKTRYIYEFPDRPEKPGRARRVKVASAGPLPWSGAIGTVITGELLHVAVLRYPPRRGRESFSSIEKDSRPLFCNTSAAERFVFVASGELRGEIDGRPATVTTRSIAHVPAGVSYGFAAATDSGALVVVAQDNRHAFQA
jgi:quercetin dioxygenase-like cupin family protein